MRFQKQICIAAILTGFCFLLGSEAIAKAANSRFAIEAAEPDKALTAYERGYHYYKTGELERSEDCFIEAVRLEPNLIKAHYWLGKLYREQGRLDDAIFHWEEAQRLTKHIGFRREALSIKDNEYPYYAQMLKTDAKIKEAKIAFDKGLYLLDQGHFNGAETELRKAVSLYGGNKSYILLLARLLWDKKEYQASVKFYRDLMSKRDVALEEFKEGFDKMLECQMGYVAEPLLVKQKERFKNDNQFNKMLSLFESKHNFKVSSAGKVLERHNGQVIINLGIKDGLSISDEFKLSMSAFKAGRLIADPDTKEAVGLSPNKPCAELLLTKVYKDTSWALIRKEYGLSVKAGDLIEFKKTSD